MNKIKNRKSFKESVQGSHYFSVCFRITSIAAGLIFLVKCLNGFKGNLVFSMASVSAPQVWSNLLWFLAMIVFGIFGVRKVMEMEDHRKAGKVSDTRYLTVIGIAGVFCYFALLATDNPFLFKVD